MFNSKRVGLPKLLNIFRTKHDVNTDVRHDDMTEALLKDLGLQKTPRPRSDQ